MLSGQRHDRGTSPHPTARGLSPRDSHSRKSARSLPFLQHDIPRIDSDRTEFSVESDAGLAPQNIVFIHDAAGPRSSRGQEIKKWCARMQKPRPSLSSSSLPGSMDWIKVKRFKFDMATLLEDPQGGLQGEVARLMKQISKLEAPKQVHRPGSSEGQREPPVTISSTRGAERPLSSVVPVFILVAHGLGCWIAREFVSQQRNTTMVINTTGLVFVDTLQSNALRPEKVYVEYLHELMKIMKPSPVPDSARLRNLAVRLSEIDARFRDAMDPSKNSSPCSFTTHFVRVWMAHHDGRPEKTFTPERKKREIFKSFFVLQHRAQESEAFKELDAAISKIQNQPLLPHHSAMAATESTNPELPSVAVPAPCPGPSANPASIAHVLSGTSSTATINWKGSDFETGFPMLSRSPSRHSKVGPEGDELFLSLLRKQPDTESPLPLTSQDHLNDILNLARLSLEKGHLKLAKTRLEEGEKLLEEGVNLPEAAKAEKLAEVHAQKFVIMISLGEYQDARSLWEKLGPWIQNSPNTKMTMETGRWFGTVLVLQGEYKEAAAQLEELTKKRSVNSWNTEEIMCRRELALAYAYLGDLRLCAENMQKARQNIAQNEMRRSYPNNMVGDGQDLEIPARINATRDSLYLTDATIDLISGNYRDALDKAKRATDNMARHLGRKHLKTLESAKLKAHLLALNSESKEAEKTCRDTLQLMEGELGRNHPQTLETKVVLVFIFRTQARFMEAVDIGDSVCQMMQDLNHPRALDAKVELAASYRSRGDYTSAEELLRDAIKKGTRRYGWDSPSILNYLSELAHCYACACHFGPAEELALAVLQRQRKIYALRMTKGKGVSLTRSATASVILEQVLRDIHYESQIIDAVRQLKGHVRAVSSSTETSTSMSIKLQEVRHNLNSILNNNDTLSDVAINDIVKKMKSGWEEETVLEQLYERFSRLWVHPYLLHTLQILAAILMRKDQPEVALGEKTVDMIWKWKVLTLGESNLSTLSSRHELAEALRQTENMSVAKEHFEYVYKERSRILDGSHPDTLSAKRELIITKCAMQYYEKGEEDSLSATGTADLANGSPAIVDDVSSQYGKESEGGETASLIDKPQNAESESRKILFSQEQRQGERHPECLKTLLWIFLVQLTSTNDSSRAEETAKVALERLGHEHVRAQRLLEVWLMEEKIVNALQEYSGPDAAKRIEAQILPYKDGKSPKDAMREVKETVKILLDTMDPESAGSKNLQDPFYVI